MKEGEVSSLLTALENICSKLFYLPARDDSESLFAPTGLEGGGKLGPVLTSYSTNVHGSFHLRVMPGLCAGGLGALPPSKAGLFSFLTVGDYQTQVERLQVWKGDTGDDTVFMSACPLPATETQQKVDQARPWV